MERPTPGPLLLSVTTAFGVIFVLSLIWIASRWKISCRKTQTSSSVNGGNTVGNGNGNVCHTAIGPSSSFASDGDVSGTTRTSLWDWINQQQNRASASSRRLLRTDEESAAMHTAEDLQQHHLDRVALIAYISDSQVQSLFFSICHQSYRLTAQGMYCNYGKPLKWNGRIVIQLRSSEE